jgi:hypothetical protein
MSHRSVLTKTPQRATRSREHNTLSLGGHKAVTYPPFALSIKEHRSFLRQGEFFRPQTALAPTHPLISNLATQPLDTSCTYQGRQAVLPLSIERFHTIHLLRPQGQAPSCVGCETGPTHDLRPVPKREFAPALILSPPLTCSKLCNALAHTFKR